MWSLQPPGHAGAVNYMQAKEVFEADACLHGTVALAEEHRGQVLIEKVPLVPPPGSPTPASHKAPTPCNLLGRRAHCLGKNGLQTPAKPPLQFQGRGTTESLALNNLTCLCPETFRAMCRLEFRILAFDMNAHLPSTYTCFPNPREDTPGQ